ncbi:YolD-like family protein [Lysinibacillus fusiformis]|uniref:YolD-like family protein n=1 Tax=Lysinibacillus fusiformis TaxID=28031 RepID=UPI0021BF921D|nr:YolD-like family protein [Lysinibacillus fusiformis]UXJ71294.1 YolD-like family protein [Lysinibacillus fusiformis]
MLNDRGAMKWGALMLPEHLQLLKEWKRSANAESPRKLSEWELEEIQVNIARAAADKVLVKLTIWEDRSYKDVRGIIIQISSYKRELVLKTLSNTKILTLDQIYAADIESNFEISEI